MVKMRVFQRVHTNRAPIIFVTGNPRNTTSWPVSHLTYSLPSCFRSVFTLLRSDSSDRHHWRCGRGEVRGGEGGGGCCSLLRKVPKVYIWTLMSFCSATLRPCRHIILQRMFHYSLPWPAVTSIFLKKSTRPPPCRTQHSLTIQLFSESKRPKWPTAAPSNFQRRLNCRADVNDEQFAHLC